jgi:hypothetical protein
MVVLFCTMEILDPLANRRGRRERREELAEEKHKTRECWEKLLYKIRRYFVRLRGKDKPGNLFTTEDTE